LRKEKPFFENPDSDNRDEHELGLESWSNSLRRDWSFIFFLFFGQLKSTLRCQTCNKISITFDNFTSIPLSLPEPSKILVKILLYRLPNELKDLLNGLPPRQSTPGAALSSALTRMDSFNSDDVHSTLL
jgi:hypothetical protein